MAFHKKVFFLTMLWGMVGGPIEGRSEILIVPDQFNTISAALTRAENNTDLTDTILLRRGTYTTAIELVSNVTIEGEETGRTFLQVPSSTPAITAADGTTIRRLTIRQGGVGILIPNNIKNVKVNNNIISNNVTQGIQCINASSPEILNNTFYKNDTAIDCTGTTNLKIQNNIISTNQNDISLDSFTLNDPPQTNYNYNLYHNNANNVFEDQNVGNPPDKNDKLGDPLFVDAENNDFHLKTGSPAIGAGSEGATHDMGAYGGSGADLRLFPVSGLTISGETNDGFTVSWKPNEDYRVKGYKVLYNPNTKPVSGGLAVCPGQVNTHSLTGITGALVTKPPPPSNFRAGVADGALELSWSRVDQNTTAEYQIDYGTVSGTYDSMKTVKGRTTEADRISNLTNGQEYFLVISTIAKPVVYVAVTALDISPPSPCTTTQNGNESHIVEAMQAEAFLAGSDMPSDSSAEIRATPEPSVRFPILEDEGACFVASLASGSPLEKYLTVLRKFRDQFLLKSKWGVWLTKLYYRTGPSAIHWIGNHEGFKPSISIFLYLLIVAISIWMWDPVAWTVFIWGVLVFLFLKRHMKRNVFFKLGGHH